MDSTKYFLLSLTMIIFLGSNQGHAQETSYTYFPGKEVKEKQKKELIDNGTINRYDRILAIYKMDTDDANELGRLQIEDYYILTNDKLIEYQKIGKSITKQTIPVYKILNIKVDTNIQIIVFEDTHKFCKLNEEHLYSHKESIVGNFNSHDGKKFYKLLQDVWVKNHSYDYMRMIFNHFYDESGNKKLHPSDSLKIRKMEELSTATKGFENLEYDDELNKIYHLDQNPLIEIRYDVIDSTYTILGIELESIPEDMSTRKLAVATFSIKIEDKTKLPYQDSLYKYLDAFEKEAESIESVIEILQ